MIGSFFNRGLVLIFGYVYPAYECYKSVDMNKPNIEQLRFWCQYWILVAFLTVFEKIGDIIIGWIPMYGEAKLAFIVYLWLPKTQGTTYIYNSLFRPYIAKHETEIDRQILELRTRAGDMAFMYWRNSAGYVQARVFDILRYIVSQSPPEQPAQPQPQVATGIPKTPVPSTDSTPSSATPPQNQGNKPIASTESSTDHRHGNTKEEEAGPSEDLKSSLNKNTTMPTQALSETSKPSNPSKEQETQADSTQSIANGNAKPTTVLDLLQEETGPFTRARLRKVTAAAAATSNR